MFHFLLSFSLTRLKGPLSLCWSGQHSQRLEEALCGPREARASWEQVRAACAFSAAHLRAREMLVSPRSPGALSSHLRRILENCFSPLSDPFVREGPSSSMCCALSVFKGYIARFFYRELGQNWVGHLCVGERPLNSRHSSRLRRVFSRLFWSWLEGFLRNYRSVSSPYRLWLLSSPGGGCVFFVLCVQWDLPSWFLRLWTTLRVSRWEDRGSRAVGLIGWLRYFKRSGALLLWVSQGHIGITWGHVEIWDFSATLACSIKVLRGSFGYYRLRTTSRGYVGLKFFLSSLKK